MFTGKCLAFFMGSVWVLALLHTLFYSWEDCGVWFDAVQSAWIFRSTTCRFIGSYIISFLHGIGAGVVIFSINTFTYYNMRKRMKLSSFESLGGPLHP
ncbi:hypothetical protein Y032_0057g2836 [Ancylostoma ceylanicum]|uniref:7TM GPCR serpentine receptor class x (Srx) domain-containing protein n=1 Tax=Ancylostoma ceylanicum TaxID=53326 RepID=A0A016U6K4_9BILA|nr:hypothetical protein Y032_0057g2836 [Ancylostoma ceylanicum]